MAGITSNAGNASNQLNQPYDVILDYANNLYIADNMNSRIQKYMYDPSTGLTIQTVAGDGTQGSSPSQLNSSSRLVMNSNRDLYITDTGNARVQCWLYGATSGSTVAGITGEINHNNYVFTFSHIKTVFRIFFCKISLETRLINLLILSLLLVTQHLALYT